MIKDTLLSKRFAIIWLPTLLCLLSCTLLNSGPAFGAVTPGGITTVAGNGSYCYSGDGGPATSAALDDPCGLAVDTSGNLYIADSDNNRVRKVDSAGIITTVAGKGRSSSSALNGPRGLTLDTSGNLYVADTWNCRVIKLSPSCAITTVAGSGFWASLYEGEGGPATRARILPDSVAVDTSGNVYISDDQDNRVFKVGRDGIITTVAGNATQDLPGGYSGDGGLATGAALNHPTGLALDKSGDLYIADSDNNRIRKVNTSGIITTVAGNGTQGCSGDGGPATGAALNYPTGLAVDTAGDLYIGDTNNYRIRKVDTSGAITSVAVNCAPSATGGLGYLRLYVAVDAAGDLYFDGVNCVRKAAAPIPPYPATGSRQSVIVFTVGQPSYTVDGQSFAMNAAPIISNGRLLVPVRYLSDALGVETAWETSGTGAVIQIQIFTCNVVALLNIGSTAMDLSIRKDMEPGVSKTTQMDVAPIIIDGRTYMAARYLTDAFGCTINWNGAAQTITVLQQPM